MKRPFLLLLSFTLIMIYGCSDIDKTFTFNIHDEANLTIPSAIGVNTPFVVNTPDIQTNSVQEFAYNNTNKDLVKDITLKALNLKIMSPANSNFSFLKSINIYIYAEGMPEKKIAYLNDIPDNAGTSIDLLTTGEKLDEFLKKDKYSIRTEAVKDKSILQDMEIKASMNFRVTADVL